MTHPHEASLPAARRRALGAHYTPPALARRLVEVALDGLDRSAPRFCDPACGAGAFLLATGEALVARGLARVQVATDLLHGCDTDPLAVDAARAAVREWSGVDPGDHLQVTDGLDAGRRWSGRFDLVVGNPPFLNQLSTATVRREALHPELRRLEGAYTDTAWVFLVAALTLVDEGGRVLLIQPQSVAGARDAQAVRVEVQRRAVLEGMWSAPGKVFPDTAVRVCAPLLRIGGPPAASVRRWQGLDVAPATPIEVPGPGSWAAALCPPDPPPSGSIPERVDARLGSLVTATAGFRQQFYGLVPYVHDAEHGADPLLVTSGLVDPAGIAWGRRPVRFAGRRLMHPRVDLRALGGGDPRLHDWVRARLVPKVVLATQTRVLEAAVDATGCWVPSTPVIAVHARAEDLWRVAAVLLAPPVTAWAVGQFAGTALSSTALKLPARAVAEIPLPIDHRRWAVAAGALREGDVMTAAAEMTLAYGAGPATTRWWAARAGLAG